MKRACFSQIAILNTYYQHAVPMVIRGLQPLKNNFVDIKKITIIKIACIFCITNIGAQSNINYSSSYGSNLYLSETGSGYGLSTNSNFYVQEYNRTFELGLILNDKHCNISGLDFTYKHFLGFRSAHLYDKPLTFFIYYNFIYRIPATIINTNSGLKSAPVDTFLFNNKITTFEHYVGLGVKLRLKEKFYFEMSTGFGVYLGSRYKGSTPKTWGFHLNNHGYVPSFKMGVGLQF
jgi:hypothetical protein